MLVSGSLGHATKMPLCVLTIQALSIVAGTASPYRVVPKTKEFFTSHWKPHGKSNACASSHYTFRSGTPNFPKTGKPDRVSSRLLCNTRSVCTTAFNLCYS